ncbi:MAG: TlpA family protein disulfide reductase [Gemmatimonas sp.]
MSAHALSRWMLAATCVAAVTACGSSENKSTSASKPDSAAAPVATSGAYKALKVGDQAPLYEMPTLAGDSVHIGKASQPVTVMNVWATWCVSCREEMQDLQGLQNDYKAKGVRVVGVSVDEIDTPRVRRFIERDKLSFTIVHDQQGRVQPLYQVSGIPNTFIVDGNGRILWKSIGNLHGVVDSLRRVLDAAVK